MTTPDKIELRVHGRAVRPVLIYLPGLHGDWTLVGGFRRALADRVRFVDMTYPRTLTWSLDDYAAAIEQALSGQGIDHGWLLGESFGSQVLWALASRNHFRADGLILAGGFGRYPVPFAVRCSLRFAGRRSYSVLSRLLPLYERLSRWRYGRSPAALAEVREFVARRTELDAQAARHRLELIAANQPAAAIRQCQVPVHALTGLFDPVVPWWPVQRWLRANCPNLREYKLIWRADHTVLATAPKAAATHILRWMGAMAPIEAQS